MSVSPFAFSRLPDLRFGEGSRASIPDLVGAYGRRLLLVIGGRSLRASRHWVPLTDAMAARKLAWMTLVVEAEPSPDLVDDAVSEHHASALDAVLGIGGGSVLDAAKAIAALLPSGRSVMDHIEEVGAGVPYDGPALPLVLAPTTAGTGSEVTKNAVISRRGPGGFKKSFRHDALIPRHAIVDPELLEACPPEVIAADGLDALTQLLESYVSPRAGPWTDRLAEAGLAALRESLFDWFDGADDARAARSRMALAALNSGVALTNAGLGAVHGLASPLGALTPARHGVICGTLLGAVTRANVAALRARDPGSHALDRYGRAWTILTGETATDPVAPDDAPERLGALLDSWVARLGIPTLDSFGVRPADFASLVADCRGGSMKTNPIVLTDDEIEGILKERTKAPPNAAS